jgi:hypothetical protein
MTRETRFNLIFLAIFLAVSLPGAVILVKKKMRPGATPAPLSRPDPVRRELPYMAPQVTSDRVTRYVPPVARQWLSEIDRSRGGSGEFLLRDRQPVMSDDRSLQVLNATDSTVTLILWESIKEPIVKVDSQIVERETHRAEIPPAVRSELQDGGFVDPPNSIVWLRAPLPASVTRSKAIQIQVRSGDAANPAAKSVNLFTS